MIFRLLLLEMKKQLEMPGIEPGAFHMQSERATTALHPLLKDKELIGHSN